MISKELEEKLRKEWKKEISSIFSNPGGEREELMANFWIKRISSALEEERERIWDAAEGEKIFDAEGIEDPKAREKYMCRNEVLSDVQKLIRDEKDTPRQ